MKPTRIKLRCKDTVKKLPFSIPAKKGRGTNYKRIKYNFIKEE